MTILQLNLEHALPEDFDGSLADALRVVASTLDNERAKLLAGEDYESAVTISGYIGNMIVGPSRTRSCLVTRQLTKIKAYDIEERAKEVAALKVQHDVTQ